MSTCTLWSIFCEIALVHTPRNTDTQTHDAVMLIPIEALKGWGFSPRSPSSGAQSFPSHIPSSGASADPVSKEYFVISPILYYGDDKGDL